MSEDVQALRRSLRAATRGRASIDGAEDLAALVDDLEKRGWIRRVRILQEGPGRPRSPREEGFRDFRYGFGDPTASAPFWEDDDYERFERLAIQAEHGT